MPRAVHFCGLAARAPACDPLAPHRRCVRHGAIVRCRHRISRRGPYSGYLNSAPLDPCGAARRMADGAIAREKPNPTGAAVNYGTVRDLCSTYQATGRVSERWSGERRRIKELYTSLLCSSGERKPERKQFRMSGSKSGDVFRLHPKLATENCFISNISCLFPLVCLERSRRSGE
jgi:hypothetical protein